MTSEAKEAQAGTLIEEVKPPVGTAQVPPEGDATPHPEPRPGDEETFEQRYKGLSTAYTKLQQANEQLKTAQAGTAQILTMVQGMADRLDTQELHNTILQVSGLAGDHPEDAMKIANGYIAARSGELKVNFAEDPRFADVRVITDPTLRLNGYRMVSRVIGMEQAAKTLQPGDGKTEPGKTGTPSAETTEQLTERVKKETLASLNAHTVTEPGGGTDGSGHLTAGGKIAQGLQQRKDQK